jgi:hypothetical protein
MLETFKQLLARGVRKRQAREIIHIRKVVKAAGVKKVQAAERRNRADAAAPSSASLGATIPALTVIHASVSPAAIGMPAPPNRDRVPRAAPGRQGDQIQQEDPTNTAPVTAGKPAVCGGGGGGVCVVVVCVCVCGGWVGGWGGAHTVGGWVGGGGVFAGATGYTFAPNS